MMNISVLFFLIKKRQVVNFLLQTTNRSNYFTQSKISLHTMKYTKYFSGVIKNQGIPHLNVEQYGRFMNIVSLEGKLQELIESIDNP